MSQKIGILYDHKVMNYPLVRQVMWWHVVGSHFLIETTEDSPELRHSVAVDWREFPQMCQDVAPPPEFVDELPLDELAGLVVLRSHPEMFGPQIRYMRERDPEWGVDVWTIETTRNNAWEDDES